MDYTEHKKYLEKDMFNDELLNKFITSLEGKKWNDKILLELTPENVLRIIKSLVIENINVDLSLDTIAIGLNKRKDERKMKEIGEING